MWITHLVGLVESLPEGPTLLRETQLERLSVDSTEWTFDEFETCKVSKVFEAIQPIQRVFKCWVNRIDGISRFSANSIHLIKLNQLDRSWCDHTCWTLISLNKAHQMFQKSWWRVVRQALFSINLKLCLLGLNESINLKHGIFRIHFEEGRPL